MRLLFSQAENVSWLEIWFKIHFSTFHFDENFQAAEKAFKFYNKHQLDTKDKDSSNQFEGMKLVAKEVEEDPKIALKDISKEFKRIIWPIGFKKAISFIN